MFDSPKSNNIVDFQRRYVNGYGFLHKTDGNKALVYISSRSNDKRIIAEDEDNFQFQITLDSVVVFEFIPVYRGWVDIDDKAVFSTRHPARQWTRSVCSSNTKLVYYSPERKTLMALTLTYRIAEGLLRPTYNPKQALQDYLTGVKEYAVLSKHFAIGGDGLYVSAIPVGSVEKQERGLSVTMTQPLFKQEFSDLLNRNTIEGIQIK